MESAAGAAFFGALVMLYLGRSKNHTLAKKWHSKMLPVLKN